MKQQSHSHSQSGFTISAAQQWCRPVAAKRPRTHSARIDRSQSGFTIVELMIATLVFSVILLVITYGILHFSSAYYKGLNSSTTQNTARSIIDTVSQAIQFSGTPVVPTTTSNGVSYFCAGGQIYVYYPGVVYDGSSPSLTQPGLYVNSDNGSCNLLSAVAPGGKELLGKDMRLAFLTVSNPGGGQAYTVAIRLVYGDTDLLCSPSITGLTKGSCQNGAPSYNPTDTFAANDVVCKLQTGSQFCAVSALSTTVLRRVTGS